MFAMIKEVKHREVPQYSDLENASYRLGVKAARLSYFLFGVLLGLILSFTLLPFFKI